MNIFIVTFVVMVLVIVGMAIGVLFGRSPIKGSCGGMQNLGMKGKCDICGGDTQKCEEEQKKNGVDSDKNTDLAYDAAKKK